MSSKALGRFAVAQRDIQRAQFGARWIVAALKRPNHARTYLALSVRKDWQLVARA